MTPLKKQIREHLLSKGLVEQPTSSGICYIHRYCKGDWQGQDWAKVRFPNNHDNRIEVRTGYTGAASGDEGYSISTYQGQPKSFDDFLIVLQLTEFNTQVEKGKNQYVFSQVIADYKG